MNIMVRNYQKELDGILEEVKKSGKVPRLLLHSCCAPCSSYVLEYLSAYFEIEDFFYNPNIAPEEEYRFRAEELSRLIREMPLQHAVHFREGPYEPDRFYTMAEGLEDIPEGGERCERCFALRLEEAARAAREFSCDYFIGKAVSLIRTAVFSEDEKELLVQQRIISPTWDKNLLDMQFETVSDIQCA